MLLLLGFFSHGEREWVMDWGDDELILLLHRLVLFFLFSDAFHIGHILMLLEKIACIGSHAASDAITAYWCVAHDLSWWYTILLVDKPHICFVMMRYILYWFYHILLLLSDDCNTDVDVEHGGGYYVFVANFITVVRQILLVRGWDLRDHVICMLLPLLPLHMEVISLIMEVLYLMHILWIVLSLLLLYAAYIDAHWCHALMLYHYFGDS